MAKHWGLETLKVVEQSDYGSKHGYCAICHADMAYYPGEMGLRHYASHKWAKRLGLNWQRKAQGR